MDDYATLTEREVAEWPGASVSFDNTKRHRVAVLAYRGRTRRVVFAATPSDSARGLPNHIGEVRKELRGLGASRRKQQPSPHRDRQRNKPVRLLTIETHPAVTLSEPQTGLAKLKGMVMASIAQIAPTINVPAGTVDWFNQCVERGKREVFSERVKVTPGLAAVILERNPDNRNISPTKAGHYARDMVNGMWAENGETVIVSKDGLLNDGQHRLQAVIDSNTVQPFLIVFGVSRESRITVDQGGARGAGDYLAMDGVSYAKNASTAAKFIIAYERADGRNISQRPFITNAEIVARVKADAEIIRSAAYAAHHYKAYRSLFSNTVMMACHYILSEVDAAAATAYLDQIALGENIKRGDPAFAVRQAFMTEKRERQEAMEIIFHGWNAYRQGRSIKQVRSLGTLPALV